MQDEDAARRERFDRAAAGLTEAFRALESYCRDVATVMQEAVAAVGQSLTNAVTVIGPPRTGDLVLERSNLDRHATWRVMAVDDEDSARVLIAPASGPCSWNQRWVHGSTLIVVERVPRPDAV